MAGEIVVPDDLSTTELLHVPVQDKVAIQEMTAPAYLPRLELFTASKNLVKAGKFAVNNWGIVKAKDRVVDIGKKIHAYPVSWRFKAMNFTDLKKVGSNFDNKSDEFKRWKLEAEKKLPQGVLSKYMAGIEFLMCINGFDGLVTYMCASVSQKGNVAELIAFLEARKFVEMDSYWKVTPDFQFQCPTVKLFEGEFDLPPVGDINRVTYKFLNTKVEEHEKDLEGGDEVKVDVQPERAH